MTRAAILAVLALAGCKTDRESVPAPTARSSAATGKQPATAPSAPATDPVTADALIHAAQKRAPDHVLSRIQIEYVAADGMLDPRYSKASIVFTQAPTEPSDDPERPTGAPVAKSPKPARLRCPTWTWEPGSWSTTDGSCGAQQIEAVRCPVTVIWQRAIDDGAPRDALAKLTLLGRSFSYPYTF